MIRSSWDWPAGFKKILEDASMHLLIVDDHPIVSSGIRLVLSGDEDIVVHDARSIAQARNALKHRPADIVLVGNNLPDGRGLDFCSEALANNPSLRVIIFSIVAAPLVALEALQRGAKGFLSKTGEVTSLREAIRTVASGQIWLPDQITQDLAFLRVRNSALRFTLNDREQTIIRNLIKGLSLGQIAKTISVSHTTVAKDCKSLKGRLNARDLDDLVRIAADLNLV